VLCLSWWLLACAVTDCSPPEPPAQQTSGQEQQLNCRSLRSDAH
jgi:hypothetical protein